MSALTSYVARTSIVERLTSPGAIGGPGVSSGPFEVVGPEGGSVVSAGGRWLARGVGASVSAATWVDGTAGGGAGEQAAVMKTTANTAIYERPLTRLTRGS
jgi:hypothetical protein